MLSEVVLAFFRTFLVVTDPMWGVLGALKRLVDFRMFRILRCIAGLESGGDERQSSGEGSGSQDSIMVPS